MDQQTDVYEPPAVVEAGEFAEATLGGAGGKVYDLWWYWL